MSPRGVGGKFTAAQKAELRRGFVESRATYEADLADLITRSKAVADLERERHGTAAAAEHEKYGTVSEFERELYKVPKQYRKEIR